MDKGSIEEFKIRSQDVLRGIDKLQLQIKNYKNGAESFQMAADMLGEIAKKESEILSEIEDYVAGLYKLDTEGVVEEMTELAGNIRRAQNSIEDNVDRLERMERGYRQVNDAIDKCDEMMSRIDVMEEGYVKAMKKLEALVNRVTERD